MRGFSDHHLSRRSRATVLARVARDPARYKTFTQGVRGLVEKCRSIKMASARASAKRLRLLNDTYRMLNRDIRMGAPMRTTVGTRVCVIAIGFLCMFASAVDADEGAGIHGTYSSFAYNAEGGDLLGIEVHIVPTRHGVRAIVQSAEGEPGDIDVVEIKQGAGGTLSFKVPMVGQTGVRFEGKVTTDGLKGKLIYSSGTTEEVFLKRTTSYWERYAAKP